MEPLKSMPRPRSTARSSLLWQHSSRRRRRNIWPLSMRPCGCRLVSRDPLARQTHSADGYPPPGRLTELMGDPDGAIQAYEQALRHNQWSIPAMNAISCILRAKEQFHKAVEYLQNILKLDATNGETWGSLGGSCVFLRRPLID